MYVVESSHATGVYGRRGSWNFDRPFPYARPYISRVQYGSPFILEVIVPTILLSPAVYFGLPRFLDLMEKVALFPSAVARGRAENKAAQREAKVRQIRAVAQLHDPGALERASRAQVSRESSSAGLADLRDRAEAAELLEQLPPESRQAVLDS